MRTALRTPAPGAKNRPARARETPDLAADSLGGRRRAGAAVAGSIRRAAGPPGAPAVACRMHDSAVSRPGPARGANAEVP